MIELNPNNSKDFITKIRAEQINPLKKIISNTQAKITSKFHIWWAKKPGNITQKLIEHFTDPNKIILDPFSGSGTVLEQAIKLNRKCIALDLNPLSIFLMENLVSIKDWRLIENYFNVIMTKLERELKYRGFSSTFDLYQTICPICNGKARINYMIWDNNAPIAIRLHCEIDGNVTKNKIDLFDIELIKKIDDIPINSEIKNISFMENSRINISKNMKLADFFTKRNFLALSSLINEINSLEKSPEREFLRFVFSSTLRKTSKLISTKGGLSVGFWIPKTNRKENNVFLQFQKTKEKLFKQKEYLIKLSINSKIASTVSELKSNKNILIDKYDATKLANFVPKDSIDLIITDPPYADEVPYLELSQLWNPWLDFEISSDDLKNEIILTNSPERLEKNMKTEDGIRDYEKLLKRSFKQMFQVLKDNKFVLIWFKEAELKIWNLLIQGVLDAGFIYIDQMNIITDVRSLKHKFSPKHSLTGHVLIFFLKKDGIKVPTRELEWNAIENLIRTQSEKIILKNFGKATTSELYNGLGIREEGIISKLIKTNSLKLVSKKHNNLFYFFNKNLKFDKNSNSWFKN